MLKGEVARGKRRSTVFTAVGRSPHGHGGFRICVLGHELGRCRGRKSAERAQNPVEEEDHHLATATKVTVMSSTAYACTLCGPGGWSSRNSWRRPDCSRRASSVRRRLAEALLLEGTEEHRGVCLAFLACRPRWTGARPSAHRKRSRTGSGRCLRGGQSFAMVLSRFRGWPNLRRNGVVFPAGVRRRSPLKRRRWSLSSGPLADSAQQLVDQRFAL